MNKNGDATAKLLIPLELVLLNFYAETVAPSSTYYTMGSAMAPKVFHFLNINLWRDQDIYVTGVNH